MFKKLSFGNGSETTDSTLDLTLTPENGDLQSPGASSSFSIPWAEDAIRQNWEEWNRIEMMMYGEEALPADDEPLRKELLEWMTAFPHLRVIGEPVSVYFNPKMVPSDPDYEEILAIHPFDENRGRAAGNIPIRTLDFEGLSLGKGIVEKVKTIEIEPNGRVTSSVVYRKFKEESPANKFFPEMGGFTTQLKKESFHRTSLMPSKSATMRPSLTLPSISAAQQNFDVGVVGRSISATLHSRKHTKRKTLLPNLSGEES